MSRPVRCSTAEIQSNLTALPQWQCSGEAITRTLVFPDFPHAVAFVTRVVEPAEAMQHHPDVDIRYNRVTITLSTHDAGGLTASDFILAERIDALVR